MDKPAKNKEDLRLKLGQVLSILNVARSLKVYCSSENQKHSLFKMTKLGDLEVKTTEPVINIYTCPSCRPLG